MDKCDKSRCIANIDGECCAEKCDGEIISLRQLNLTRENVRKFYDISSGAYDKYFSDDFVDEDTEE